MRAVRAWTGCNPEEGMTKKEFITKLRCALSGKLDAAKITEHASYYEEYIEIQVRKGREEQQVTEELGDPALLVKSILNAERDGKSRLSEAGLRALGIRVKGIALELGQRVKQKAINWFENLR